MYLLGPYDDALAQILKHGVLKSNQRTGVKTLAVCGIQCRYGLDERFPLMTRRKVWPKAIFAELLWFLSGSTNNHDLQDLGANIWTPWESEDFEKIHGYAPGSFGPTYGFQLRHFGGHYGNGIGGKAHYPHNNGTYDDYVRLNGWKSVRTFTDEGSSLYGAGGFDQLTYMMERIRQDSRCRRILFSLWNPRDLPKQRLPPCHYTYQVFIDDDRRLTGHLTQRSNDYFIGVCANVQFYAALTCMIAQQTGFQPYEFVHEAVDAHIYEPHIPFVEEYLATPILESPILTLNKAENIYSYKLTDFVLERFISGPKITAPVMV